MGDWPECLMPNAMPLRALTRFPPFKHHPIFFIFTHRPLPNFFWVSWIFPFAFFLQLLLPQDVFGAGYLANLSALARQSTDLSLLVGEHGRGGPGFRTHAGGMGDLVFFWVLSGLGIALLGVKVPPLLIPPP